MSNILIVHSLDKNILNLNLANVDRIICFEILNGYNHGLYETYKKLSINKIEISPTSKFGYEVHERAYNLIEQLFSNENFKSLIDKHINNIRLENCSALIALKKSISSSLRRVCHLFLYADLYLHNQNVTFIVNKDVADLLRFVNIDKHYNMIAITEQDSIKIKKIILSKLYILVKRNSKQILAKSGKLLTKITTNIFNKSFSNGQNLSTRRLKQNIMNGTSFAYIFDQSYSWHQVEFSSFFYYLQKRSDVLYLVPDKKWEIYSFLKKEHKPVVSYGETIKMPQKMCLLLILFFKCIPIGVDRSLPLLIKKGLYMSLKTKLFYSQIFGYYKPRFYLKIRSDKDAYQAIVRSVGDSHRVKTIGYMHGSYPFLSSTFAYIDFHYYGLLGKFFRNEIYKHTWPDTIHYKILGPFTGEIDDGKSVPVSYNDTVIGIFLTSEYDRNVYNKFIKAIKYTLSAGHYRVIFKEKLYSKYSTETINENFKDFQNYQICVHNNNQLYDEKLWVIKNSVQVLEESDFVFVMGWSTTGWEALGKKKKLIIFMSDDLSHPFEIYISRLVVRAKEELRETFEWLTSISQSEYNKIIQPLIDNCCKSSDGKLVKDFLESIENDEEASALESVH